MSAPKAPLTRSFDLTAINVTQSASSYENTMKSYKLLVAGLLAAMTASVALADPLNPTYIRFTGSSAFRASAVKAIENKLTPGFKVAADRTTTAAATLVTYVGTIASNGEDVVIQTSWTGSADGIRDITTGVSNTYITRAATLTANQTNVNSLTATTLSGNTETAVADVAMADNLQSSTSFKTPTLTQTNVGVVPFVFVKGRLAGGHPYSSAWSTLTNISPAGARALINDGTYLSILTGQTDAAWAAYYNGGGFDGEDLRCKVYALGRNPFSGTRIVTFTETGYGTSATAYQYKAYRSGDAAGSIPTVAASETINTVAQYPSQTVSGQFFATGNNGFGSGGTLANELSATVKADAVDANGAPFGLVGYMGTSDAGALLRNVFGNTTQNNAATAAYILTYNGTSLPVTLTAGGSSATVTWDFTAVQEGRYSFFGNEYLSYVSSTIGTGTVKRNFADAVATEIKDVTAGLAGVKLSDMKVNRAAEGSLITAK